MSLVCVQCRAPVLPTDRYCPRCGAPPSAAVTRETFDPMLLPAFVRRLSRGLLVELVIAGLLLAAGTGAALALVFGGRDSDQTVPTPPTSISATPGAEPTVGPPGASTPTAGAGPTVGPPGASTSTPRPDGGTVATAAPPTEALSPTAAPTPAAPGMKLVNVETIGLQVPVTWRVTTADPTFIQIDATVGRVPGILRLSSDDYGHELDLAKQQESLVSIRTEGSPDARYCAEPRTAAVPGGPVDGVFFALCYAHESSISDRVFPVTEIYFLGVQGSNMFAMRIFAASDGIGEWAGAVYDLPAPRWNLYRP